MLEVRVHPHGEYRQEGQAVADLGAEPLGRVAEVHPDRQVHLDQEWYQE